MSGARSGLQGCFGNVACYGTNLTGKYASIRLGMTLAELTQSFFQWNPFRIALLSL